MRTSRLLMMSMAALLAVMTALAAPAAGAAADRRGDIWSPWENIRAGELAGPSHISSVAAAGPHAAWAAGTRWVDSVPHGIILRWNGKRWERDRTDGLPQVRHWHSVSALSPHEVWAYGWGGDLGEVVVHYDGRRWRNAKLPRLPDGAIYGFSELAAERGITHLAGESRITTYAHGTWRSTPLPRGVQITEIDARSPRDAWAVGGFALVGSVSRPVVMHWNGRSWRQMPTPFTGMWLTEVYAESAHSIWASGIAPRGEEGYQPTVLHWDGHTWQEVTGPVGGLLPQALSGDGRGRIWLSGDPDGWQGPPVYWRYQAGAWRRVAGPAVPGGQTQGYQVTDLAPIGRTGRHWAVGGYELLDGHGGAENRELIQRSRR